MPKYTVHLYPIVRVTVSDVEADDQVEAIKKAEDMVVYDALFWARDPKYPDFPAVTQVEYADDIDGYLVDEDGDTEHERSREYDAGYRPV